MAAAEALFSQARELFDAGKIGEACEKFAESQRLDPSPGTLLNLARCHEEEGKTASAWSEYLAAKRAAKSSGRDSLAEESARRAAELEGKLSHLTIEVTAEVEGLKITRNDDELAPATFATKLPVDPGTYTISAEAPGYEPWSSEVVVKHGEAASLTVPALVARAAPAEAETDEGTAEAEQSVVVDPSTAPADPNGAPVAAYVIGGAGLVVTGVGLAFGAMASGAYKSADEACPLHTACSDEAMKDRDSAGTYALVSTVAVPVGLAGLATGIILWATHGGTPPPETAHADVTWVPGGGVAHFRGSF
jgi:hypothetical protein